MKYLDCVHSIGHRIQVLSGHHSQPSRLSRNHEPPVGVVENLVSQRIGELCDQESPE